jgi:hypothetical protein
MLLGKPLECGGALQHPQMWVQKNLDQEFWQNLKNEDKMGWSRAAQSGMGRSPESGRSGLVLS